MKVSKINIILIICIFASQFVAESASATKTNNHAINQLFSLKRIGEISISADGKQVAYTLFQVKNHYPQWEWEYSLYLKDNQGKVNLLTKEPKISSPVWSPDEKCVAYIAKGVRFQSLWIYNLQNHKKIKLIEFKSDMQSFKWAPNGKFIAFTADEEKPKSKILMPKDVAKDFNNTRLYLFSIDTQTTSPLTSATYSVSQYFIYPGFDWAPNSQSIAFAYQPQAGDAYSHQNKIAILDLKTRKTYNLSYTLNHNSTQPAYSPDGKWIAFQSNPSETEVIKKLNYKKSNKPSPLLIQSILKNNICVFNLKSKQTYCLANTYNQNPFMIGWNYSSNQILAFDPYHKTLGPRIFSLTLNPKIPAESFSNVEGFIEPLTISLNSSHKFLGFGYDTTSNPPEIFMTPTDTFKLTQISQIQLPSINSKKLGTIQTIHWASFDGKEIEGLLMLPSNYNPHQKYPLLVSLHGGPTSAWSKRYIGGSDEYEEMIDPTTVWQNYLDQGFIIFQPNPRGSDGYGLDFRFANFADFGGGDYRDVIAGVDYLIKKRIADANHLAIAGWSYGGYLTTWTISQTQRFKAAVEGDGNINLISMSGTSDALYFTPSYLGNFFWDNNRLYIHRSPIFYAKNITTPLLIIVGENDDRIPVSQGYEIYRALELQKKQVKMLILPSQGHVPTNPNLIYDSIKEINNWLKKAL